MGDWQAIANGISEAQGYPFEANRVSPVDGGCINEAVCLESLGQRFFVKLNESALLPMFEAEAAGLKAILATGTIAAPRPVTLGVHGNQSWLALEFIEFGPASEQANGTLGEQLAQMHRSTADHFGWDRDNTIGSTPQINTPEPDWITFLHRHRLGSQLQLAAGNGVPGQLLDAGNQLLEHLPAFFAAYNPMPSLLHGDLWGGNWSVNSDARPVIFDPAVYYGDREADLAMTELFGGFSDRFYHSYRSCWDIDPGYTERKVLYKLYHVLNHYNLFGGNYARQAQDMIDQLNAEVD